MGRVFTHSGIFHADDVFAVATVRLAGFSKEPIVRVRELPQDFDASGDIAVDVGGRFDVASNIFDHHFRGGNDDGKAACGKVWSVFGEQLCGDKRIAERVYDCLLGSVDRADIGINDWQPVSDTLRHVSLSGFISTLNPPFGSNEGTVFNAFIAACNAAEISIVHSIAQARDFIEMGDIIDRAVYFLDEVILLEKGGPWQEHVFNRGLTKLLYVMYPSDRGGYIIQCVPDKLNSFSQRKPLPVQWKGLRGKELNAVLGGDFTEDQALFCHDGLFIGGASNREEVVRLAIRAVNNK
jgi:uncharacterized UPF0160 family protein